jgi:hypothetical protein
MNFPIYEDSEELTSLKAGLAELGWSPKRLAKRMISLGDTRSPAAILRSVNRAYEGDTKVSGQLAAFVKLQVRQLRLLRKVHGDLNWVPFDSGEKAHLDGYTLVVDKRREKWAVSVTYRTGRSEQWPNHLDSIELAKDFALIMLDDCMDFVDGLRLSGLD